MSSFTAWDSLGTKVKAGVGSCTRTFSMTPALSSPREHVRFSTRLLVGGSNRVAGRLLLRVLVANILFTGLAACTVERAQVETIKQARSFKTLELLALELESFRLRCRGYPIDWA